MRLGRLEAKLCDAAKSKMGDVAISRPMKHQLFVPCDMGRLIAPFSAETVPSSRSAGSILACQERCPAILVTWKLGMEPIVSQPGRARIGGLCVAPLGKLFRRPLTLDRSSRLPGRLGPEYRA